MKRHEKVGIGRCHPRTHSEQRCVVVVNGCFRIQNMKMNTKRLSKKKPIYMYIQKISLYNQ